MNHSILFISHDSEEIRKKISIIDPEKNGYTFYFAKNGIDAIDLIVEKDISLLVIDLRLLQKDSSDFLTIIQNEFPKIFRIGLTVQELNTKNPTLTKVFHRFLPRPLDINLLMKTISDLLRLNMFGLDASLVGKINGLGLIPVLPDIYVKLTKEINSPVISMNRIADIISVDPLMVARILHIAHSSFFNIPTGVSNLFQAINFLGVNIIKTLVLYVKIFSLSNIAPETEMLLKKVRVHSINVARLSRAIMENEGGSRGQVEDAYIAGLLHDVGKIVLLQLNDVKKSSLYYLEMENVRSTELEKDRFGVTHVNVGAYILRLWDFPDNIIDAIASHHNPVLVYNEIISINEAVFIANIFCNHFDELTDALAKTYGQEKFNRLKGLMADHRDFS